MMDSPSVTRTPRSTSHRTSWLLFVHQLPSSESNLRVRLWRRLQQLGALALKQAVYLLPDSDAAREDLEWLRQEVDRAGGQADVFTASGVQPATDDRLVEEFRTTRRQAYEVIADEADNARLAHEQWSRRKRDKAPESGRALDGIRQRFQHLQHIDYFGSPGRDYAARRIAALEAALGLVREATSPSPRRLLSPAAYRNRVWVTRPRPGVDRMSSAWLIRRFIDPAARFGFADSVDAAPKASVTFDMFGGMFTHVGARCTFEELSEAFDIREATVVRIAAIVHDLDVKDGHFGIPDAAVVGTLIEGLQLAHADDHVLLEQGMALFEALYQGVRAPGGRTQEPRPARTSRSTPQRRAAKASTPSTSRN